jgi:CheY-like chemotaxis protein
MTDKHPRTDVLIVDTDGAHTVELSRALRAAGHSTELASSTPSAIERLLGSRPRVILIDPFAAGRLLGILERHPMWSLIPVVVMTDNPGSILAEALRLGGMHVLCKPLPMRALLAAIGRLGAAPAGQHASP